MTQATSDAATTGRARPRAGVPEVLTVVGAVALGGGLGALGGWLWWRWWGPPHEGEIYRTDAGPAWYPDPLDPGFARVFDATAQFVVVGLAAGAVLGVVLGLVARRRALAGLAGVLLAAAVASYVASRVGLSFSPPDPRSLVPDHQVGDRLPAAMVLTGWTPYLAAPVGGLLGFLAVVLSMSSVGEVRRREADAAGWLAPGGTRRPAP